MKEMTEENTRGFVACLQIKSDSGELSYMERKYLAAAERIKKKK